MEFEREILIAASPETIFEFLTVADKHKEWEGTEVEIDLRPGGVYRVLIAGEHQAVGEFIEIVPNEKVAYTFGWDVEGNPITPGSTTIEITLEAEGDKTRVRLRHSGLPDENAVMEHGGGWDHYLARLGVVASGGDLGPDVAGSHDG